MSHRRSYGWNEAAVVVVLSGLLAWPTSVGAQTATGQATAVQATVIGLLGDTTTVLASTGPLGETTDPLLQASALTGNVPSLLTGEVLHATTVGAPDQVDAQASLANLALTVAGITIGADLVVGRAVAIPGDGAGTSNIDNLSINGARVVVTGDPNQTIDIPGGVVVINEQRTSPTSTVVNALHVIVYGVANVIIGSAVAGIQ